MASTMALARSRLRHGVFSPLLEESLEIKSKVTGSRKCFNLVGLAMAMEEKQLLQRRLFWIYGRARSMITSGVMGESNIMRGEAVRNRNCSNSIGLAMPMEEKQLLQRRLFWSYGRARSIETCGVTGENNSMKGEAVGNRNCSYSIGLAMAMKEKQLLQWKAFFWRHGGERSMETSRICHAQSDQPDPPINREWLAQHVRALKEKRNMKRRQSSQIHGMSTTSCSNREAFHQPPDLETPFPSQPLTGVLEPSTPEEMTLAPIVARTDLVITRNIEWANLLVGFEQENRYVIVDPRQNLAVVGFIYEQSHLLFRQFLRTRRPFTASVMDASGTVLFMIRRPAWLINSTIYVEVNGKVVGEVHRRWHLWKRIYDLYVGKQQFAVVENPGFWNWTFTVKDENGVILAEIDRHFRGFGYEFLTDAGQYALRFGDMAPQYQPVQTHSTMMAGQAPNSQFQGIKATGEAEMETFSVDRPLNLLERAVTLALAVSLDNDYFSRHGGTGWFIPLPFFGESE